MLLTTYDYLMSTVNCGWCGLMVGGWWVGSLVAVCCLFRTSQ